MIDPSNQQLVIQLHLFSTLLMTGVVWFVQLVHYPSFRFVADEKGSEAARFHQRKTGLLVIPLMLIEMGTGILLMSSSWVTQYGNYLIINLGLLFLVWGVTFLKMVPLHRKLAEQISEETVSALISINWIRTVLWTARAGLLLSFLN
jgi:hypothetical protein